MNLLNKEGRDKSIKKDMKILIEHFTDEIPVVKMYLAKDIEPISKQK